MKFIKKNLKYIILAVICLFCTVLTTFATNYAVAASEVRFDKTGTVIQSDNVQDAIDEIYYHVTDYNEIKTTVGTNTLTTTAQNVTGAVNELNDYYKIMGTNDNPVTSLDDLPLNGTGGVVLAASISPSGVKRQHSYWKSGLSATRYNVIVLDINTNKMYMNDMYDGTLKGWQEIEINSDVEKVGHSKWLGTKLTTAALGTALDAELASMDTYSSLTISFTFGATVEPFRNNYTYHGTLYKGGATTYSHAIVYPLGNGAPIHISRSGDGWVFESLYSLFLPRTIVPSNANLDDYTTAGVYMVQNSTAAKTITNCPYTSAGGRLEVLVINGVSAYLKQIYYPGGNTNYFYYRSMKDNGTWDHWYKYTDDKYYFYEGEEYSFTSTIRAYGAITSSTKSIVVVIPMQKSVENLPATENITITSLKMGIRGVQGWVDIFTAASGERIGAEGYTFSLSKRNYNGSLCLTITKDTAFTNAVNESPVQVSINALVFSINSSS